MNTAFYKEKPILLGRLNTIDHELYTLTGHTGDVCSLSKQEYNIIKAMNGFDSFEEIALRSSAAMESVLDIYERFKGEKRISLLSGWNQVGWCEHCGIYAAGDKCGICGEELKRLVFDPPCDPWICLDEERKFIVGILRDKFGVEVPDDIYILANNGIKNNQFFWQVAYKGQIIMRIDFKSIEESTWEYTLLADADSLRKSQYLLFDKKSIERTISANKLRQEALFRNSAAFIKECNQIYDTMPMIYFSGGKESLVMYSLYERLNLKANVLTVAPGVDFPDDTAFGMEFRKKIEANENFNYYFYQGDGQKIIDTLNEKKVLSAKDPWCRVDFKKELKNIGTRDIYKGMDFVACEGSRWYENDFRRRHPKINFIQGYQHQLWIHPIAEWTSFDVWVYLFEQNIPINPVYYKGFQRTTCWMCPIVNPFHLKCSRKYYKELWDSISDCRLEAFGDDNSGALPY